MSFLPRMRVRGATGVTHVEGPSLIVPCGADAHHAGTGEELCLAAETPVGRGLAECIEDLELLVFGFGEQMGSLLHDEAASPAARAPAGEGDGRVVGVAEIDERPTTRRVDLTRLAFEADEHDTRHGGFLPSFGRFEKEGMLEARSVGEGSLLGSEVRPSL